MGYSLIDVKRTVSNSHVSEFHRGRMISVSKANSTSVSHEVGERELHSRLASAALHSPERLILLRVSLNNG